MLGNESAKESIPIGVNFFDASKSQSGYLDVRSSLQTKTIPRRANSSYRITGIMPYDSAYSFMASGITISGNTTGCGIDADGYYRVFIESTSGTGIKNIITNYENTSGIKIVAVQFTYNTSDSPVWERIS